MALTKVIGNGVQGISNSSDATAMTIGSDEHVDFAGNADFIDGRGVRLGNSDDFQLYHDGTDNHINVTGSQTVNIQTSGNNAIGVDANGHVTKPLQPSFLARPSSQQANLAINTIHSIAFGTEVFDRNADFASNTFTAPIEGLYQLNVQLLIQQMDSATDYYYINLKTSNRNYDQYWDNNDKAGDNGNGAGVSIVALADMDAGDTAVVEISVANSGTAQMDVETASAFSGFLVC